MFSSLWKRHFFAIFAIGFMVSTCKAIQTPADSGILATTVPNGQRIWVLAPPDTDAAQVDTEKVSQARYCIGSGWFYSACHEFRSCVTNKCDGIFGTTCSCSCKDKPPKLVARTRDCHTFWTQSHSDDGSLSILTQNKLSIRPEVDPQVTRCLTFQGYRQEATYELCHGGDSQRFYWDKGQQGGYGYVKTKIGMGQGKELCLDVRDGNHVISVHTELIFSNCKPFSAGQGSSSLNQRFYPAP